MSPSTPTSTLCHSKKSAPKLGIVRYSSVCGGSHRSSRSPLGYETVRPSRVSIDRRMNLGTRSQVSHNSRRSRGGNQAAT